MLTFYRTDQCEGCKAVQDALEDLAVAQKTVVVHSAADREALDDDLKLPVLVDEKETFEGKDAILKHLEALQGFKEQWYKFQSDACYCDEEGNVE